MWAARGLRDSGARWTLYYVGGRIGVAAGRSLLERARKLELAGDLPGMHARDANRQLWGERWDWSTRGEEWTPSGEWKQALISEVMLPNLEAGGVALEIGPGGGRWSEALHEASSRLILVDITELAIALCRERFSQATDVEYVVGDGRTLAPVSDSSVDFVWSFDAFVHISPIDVRSYVEEIARVLRPAGRAVIHHAGEGSAHGGWRSSLTQELFASFASNSGLALDHRFDRWGPGGIHRVPTQGDLISVLSKPVP